MQDHLLEPAVRRLARQAAAQRRDTETPECPDSGIPAGAVPAEYGATFEPVLDTGTPDGTPTDQKPLCANSSITLPARTLLLLRAPR